MERRQIDVERLKRKLTDAGITQKDLCEMMNTSLPSFNRKIHKGTLPLTELNVICGLLDSDIDYLCGLTDKDYGYKKRLKSSGYDSPEAFFESWNKPTIGKYKISKAFNADGVTEVTITGKSMADIIKAALSDEDVNVYMVLDAIKQEYGIKPIYLSIAEDIRKAD